MADTKISDTLKDSITSVFTTINTDKITEILIAVILCVLGFVIARLISNTFIRTIGARFNPHQRLVWRRGIFYFIFLFFVIASLKEAGF